MMPETLAAISSMCTVAIDDLDKHWERCDKDTGEECRGPICDHVEHRVMVMLCDIKNLSDKK